MKKIGIPGKYAHFVIKNKLHSSLITPLKSIAYNEISLHNRAEAKFNFLVIHKHDELKAYKDD